MTDPAPPLAPGLDGIIDAPLVPPPLAPDDDFKWTAAAIARSVGLFIVAGLAEIGGG
jgi:hypothetical protein